MVFEPRWFPSLRGNKNPKSDKRYMPCRGFGRHLMTMSVIWIRSQPCLTTSPILLQLVPWSSVSLAIQHHFRHPQHHPGASHQSPCSSRSLHFPSTTKSTCIQPQSKPHSAFHQIQYERQSRSLMSLGSVFEAFQGSTICTLGYSRAYNLYPRLFKGLQSVY